LFRAGWSGGLQVSRQARDFHGTETTQLSLYIERETTLVVNGVMTMHLQSIQRVARDQLLMQTSLSIAIAPFPGLLPLKSMSKKTTITDSSLASSTPTPTPHPALKPITKPIKVFFPISIRFQHGSTK
jgi:hypothetical protein